MSLLSSQEWPRCLQKATKIVDKVLLHSHSESHVNDENEDVPSCAVTESDSNQSSSPTSSMKNLKRKFRVWAISFARLDPRIRIHRFFHGVAQRGEFHLQLRRASSVSVVEIEKQQQNHHQSSPSRRTSRPSTLVRGISQPEQDALMTASVASVFTVWRPTSPMAIRRMMLGQGVGKGLDVKGKSAKFGKLAGYVPFLQIHNQADKFKIDHLPKDARLQIYYPNETTRQLAIKVVTQVRDEMAAAVQYSQELRDSMVGSVGSDSSLSRLFNDSSSLSCSLRARSSLTSSICRPSALQKSDRAVSTTSSTVLSYEEASQRWQTWDMTNPSIDLIDDFIIPDNPTSNSLFGIEIPERLFWEAFVMRQHEHCRRWKLLSRRFSSSDSEFEMPKTTPLPATINATSSHSSNGSAADTHDSSVRSCCHRNEDLQLDHMQKILQRMIHFTAIQSVKATRTTEQNSQTEPVLEWVQDSICLHSGKPLWSFVILDPDRFVRHVLLPIRKERGTDTCKIHIKHKDNEAKQPPDHILYSRFVGALRQLGFQEQATGNGHVRFHHTYFQKDDPSLCALIGSEHDTGRTSSYNMQDANFRSLRKCSKDNRQIVLYHYQDSNPGGNRGDHNHDALCPHNLLVAYREHNRVVPVVSDFDGFLVGTKEIHFDQPLPLEQVDVMTNAVRAARDILDGNTAGRSWAEKWLYVTRNYAHIGEHQHPFMPRYGYGDRISYRLMAGVVKQLAKTNGAVRHGAECFNYGFPQEMDAEFLVISDTIEGGVRWKYVDASQLHYFLINRVQDGYTFPLNPKWIMCDSGWSKLYDKLLESPDPCVQESLNVWFPPQSGVRELIREAQAKYPTGLSFVASTSKKSQARGLPVEATFSLKANNDSVALCLCSGSVIQFSRPRLRSGLVCATNESCVPICGGVTQALVETGGQELLEDARAIPIVSETSFGPVRCVTGDAKLVTCTTGEKVYGNLGVGHVIFAAGPSYGDDFTSHRNVSMKDDLLRSAYRASLERAKEHQLQAVAFSLISAGKRGSRWDLDRALRIAMTTLRDYTDFGSVQEIHLCAFTGEELNALKKIAMELKLQQV